MTAQPCVLWPFLGPRPLTSPQAAEGQAVLAHQLAGQQAGLPPHGEAQQAQLGVADTEVHGGVPARTESWEPEVEREVVMNA